MSETSALVRMANQIARNYSYLSEADAAAAVATHLERFWTPDMRSEFVGGSPDDLDPVASTARGLLAGRTR